MLPCAEEGGGGEEDDGKDKDGPNQPESALAQEYQFLGAQDQQKAGDTQVRGPCAGV